MSRSFAMLVFLRLVLTLFRGEEGPYELVMVMPSLSYFYDPSMNEIELEEFSTGDSLDPDRPWKKFDKNKKSTHRERASYFSVKIIRGKVCICMSCAEYLGDKSSEGWYLFFMMKFPMYLNLPSPSFAFYNAVLLWASWRLCITGFLPRTNFYQNLPNIGSLETENSWMWAAHGQSGSPGPVSC